jgi:pilus assembly protein CpaF
MRTQIASAMHVVLQLTRTNDGRRRLVSLQEITGLEGEVIAMQEIFRFVRTGVDAAGKVVGLFEATGVRPKFSKRLEAWGIRLSDDMFAPGQRRAS